MLCNGADIEACSAHSSRRTLQESTTQDEEITEHLEDEVVKKIFFTLTQ